MAKKLDFGKFKELLMAKGERVGLVAAAAIGGLLLVWGLLSGMAANNKDYSKKPIEYKSAVERALAQGKTLEAPKDQDLETSWKSDQLDTRITNPLIYFREHDKTNKRLPRVIQPTPIPDPLKSEAIRLPQGISVLGAVEVGDPKDPKDKKKIKTFKQVQIDYLLAGVRGYKLSFENETFSGLKNNAGKAEPVDVLIPQRLVVVHAVYDYEKQLKEFADAYGTTVDDILGRRKPEAGKIEPEGKKKKDGNAVVEDLSSLIPKVLGLEIVRYEYAPGKLDDPPKKTLLYQFSADEYTPDKEGVKKFNHVKVDKLAELFKSAIFEDDITDQLVPYHQRGLMTPLPRLLTGNYPELRLQGITKPKPIIVKGGDTKQQPVKKVERPKVDKIDIGIKKPKDKQGEVEVEEKIKAQDMPWKELEEMAAGKYSRIDQFKGDFEILDPYGEPLQKDGAKTDPNARPKRDFRPGPGQREPKRKEDGDAEKVGPKLIRFIDVVDENAAPGTTYMYSIQVYLANPYYKKDPAAMGLNPDWTKSPVLRPDENSMTGTPPITIPQEYFFYAANQDPTESKVPRGNDLHEAKPSPGKGDMDSTRVAVQIQQWKGNSGEHQIGDWVVVERLLVRRGDPIGRRSDFIKDKKVHDELGIVMTEMPYWDSIQGAFRLPTVTKKVQDKKNPKDLIDKVEPSGIPMTFLRINPPDPILVDFEGGKRDKNEKLFKSEESNYELLLIGPDGKLFVRNSGVDSQDKDRIARYKHWRDRIVEARKDLQDTQPSMDPGPNQKNKGGR